jgi:uncharacterized protein (TIGR00369 family)
MNPFLIDLGVEVHSSELGHACLVLDLAQRHMNPWQLTHGGVLMSLLDVAMANAARSHLDDQKGVVTLEMKTSFLQAGGQAGEQLVVRGLVLHQTATLFFCESEVWLDKALVAKGSGSYKSFKMPQRNRSQVVLSEHEN